MRVAHQFIWTALLAPELGAEVVSVGAVATVRRAAREQAVPRLAEQRLRMRA
ncbi:hypothetical protein [Microbacterium sp. K24]|uniref:hypothetical protein n=1 Tax=Microbacterium sp. K24 TaxID=2305446 RepID=UPI001444567B|nr:hypothetical protein [Microbacterium sp. K24]